MKKKWLAMLLCLSLSAAVLAGCGGNNDSGDGEDTSKNDTADEKDDDDTGSASGDVIVIGFSQVGAESDWRTANTKSMENTFSEENGYTLMIDDAQQDQANQITAVRNFIQQDVDYIVIAPVTETGWDTVLQEAYDADIPVIIVDRAVDVSNEDLFTAYVGSDFVEEGERAGKWLEEYLKEEGKEDEVNIVTLQGTIGSSAQLGRTEGFGSILEENENWEMLEMQSGEFTQSKGQEVMESFLKSYGDTIDVVVAENDNMAFGAIDAIEAAGYTCGPEGDIAIITFDAVKAAFELMIEGKINVAVECNPLHGPRVEEIIEMLESGKVPGEDFDKVQYVDEDVFPAETAEDYIDEREY